MLPPLALLIASSHLRENNMAGFGHEYDDFVKLQAVFPDHVIELTPRGYKKVTARFVYDSPTSVYQKLLQDYNKENDDFFLFEALRVARGIPWCRHREDELWQRTWHKMILPMHVSFCAYEPRTTGEKADNVQLVVGCCHCKKQNVKMSHCTGCVGTQYCSTECQESAWPSHKKSCRLANEYDQIIEILWELAGMHFGYQEYNLAQGAAEQILAFSKVSMKWTRNSQQIKLADLLEPYLSRGVVPQRGMSRTGVSVDDVGNRK